MKKNSNVISLMFILILSFGVNLGQAQDCRGISSGQAVSEAYFPGRANMSNKTLMHPWM
jgi:hypothetical protein